MHNVLCLFCLKENEYEDRPAWIKQRTCKFCGGKFNIEKMQDGTLLPACIEHHWTDYSTDTEGVEICDNCGSHQQFDLEERKEKQ